MSSEQILTLMPYLILAGAAVTALLAVAFRRNHLLTALIAIGGLVLALLSLPLLSGYLPQRVTALLVLDSYAFFYLALIIAATIVTALFAYGYLQNNSAFPEEFYVLLLTAALGAAVLAAADHFASFFLGLELLSVSLYALIGYHRYSGRGIEACLKYLILAGFSSAFLAFGMALLYAETGTMEFGPLVAQLAGADGGKVLPLAGMALIITGLGFKLALVPFHMWAADVYEGAPAPVTAFVATVSKGAVFALLLRLFNNSDVPAGGALFTIFGILAVASMVAGNLLALLQENVKRLLAYSSIAHLGYLLIAFLAGGPIAVTAVTFYLVAYFITLQGALGIVALLSAEDGEADNFDHYRSLAWKNPWLAGVFTLMLLSLAGIPLTVGFVGKFYVLAAGIGSSLWLLVVLLATSSVLGLFYYLRLIAVLFDQQEKGNEMSALSKIPLAGHLTLAALALLLLGLGLFPGPLIELLQKLVIR